MRSFWITKYSRWVEDELTNNIYLFIWRYAFYAKVKHNFVFVYFPFFSGTSTVQIFCWSIFHWSIFHQSIFDWCIFLWLIFGCFTFCCLIFHWSISYSITFHLVIWHFDSFSIKSFSLVHFVANFPAVHFPLIIFLLFYFPLVYFLMVNFPRKFISIGTRTCMFWICYFSSGSFYSTVVIFPMVNFLICPNHS